MSYKAPQLSPQEAYRREKHNLLAAIGYSEQELRYMANSGDTLANSILATIESKANEAKQSILISQSQGDNNG